MLKRVGLATGMALLALPAAAADKDHAAERVLAQMVACRHTADPAARGACYDAALDRLQQQVAQNQVEILDHEQVVENRRAAFGFSGNGRTTAERAPKPAKSAKATKPAAPAELAEVDTSVASAASYGNDEWTIHMADGSVWRTTENGIVVAPRPGTKAHIHRGLMNGYFLRVGSNRAVRAMRVG